jgi:hypothetical protein
VFLLDASGSMTPCVEGVKQNIAKLADFFKSDSQTAWDVRLGFLAHSSWRGLHSLAAIGTSGMPLIEALYKSGGANGQPSPEGFFTNGIAAFEEALARIKTDGDESTLVALDVALDFPWRPAEQCHRTVIVLTDEAIETGEDVPMQKAQLGNLVKKIHRKRVKLFIFAPRSDAFVALSVADRCEYEVLGEQNDGLRNTDFAKLMDAIGKSVSSSQSSGSADDRPEPLYGQDHWGTGSGSFGADGNH